MARGHFSISIITNSDPFSVHGSAIGRTLFNDWAAAGEWRSLGCVAVRWLNPALAHGEGCWLPPDESGERSLFSSKGKRVFPACLRGSPLFPPSPSRLLAGLQRIPAGGGSCRLLPAPIPAARRALPGCPCPAVPGRTERALYRAKMGTAGLESPPAPGAGAACSRCSQQTQTQHNKPSGELTHRKRPGLMSKLVNFPDDGAEEAEAAHRSPWTPPAHECEPAAAAGLSWGGRGPSGTPRTVPSPEAAP